jgi:L-asparaginase II
MEIMNQHLHGQCSLYVGKHEGFIAVAKQKNPGTVFTHCFLHRETLISKSVVPKVKKVLDKMIKLVNHIKSWPIHSRLFSAMFSAMEAAHK